MNRKAWLDELFYSIGRQWTNFKVTYTFRKDNEIIYTKWISYLDFQSNPTLYSKVNQRTLLINEIVLDYDEDVSNYQKIIYDLKKRKFEFYAYSTKNNHCLHIHLFFGVQFGLLPEFKRKEYREALIRLYGCDSQLKTENHCIALENVPHWKTGDIKELIAYG